MPTEKKTTKWLIASWAKGYNPAWFSSDIIAGVTLAAFAIPVSLAYASLAGLPPQHGIYCYLAGGIAYAIFGSSRQLAIGPTSAIAMLVGGGIAPLTSGDPDRWLAIASLTALTVAAISILAWVLRLSCLMSFVSETILIGFKAGAALTIGMAQLPKLFGVASGSGNFFERGYQLAGQLPETNLVVIIFGLTALVILVVGELLLPGRPIALVVVGLSILVMSVTSLSEYGLEIVGVLPPGLPDLRWPGIGLRDVEEVIPLALACFLLSYIESASSARTLAAKNGYEIDSARELLSLGVANLAVAVTQGFPVAGGLSQSAVNDKAGAKTPLSLLITSGSVALCLLFFTSVIRNLPSVVLASVVLVAVRSLIDIPALRRLHLISRYEFWLALVALMSVLFLGILKGVLVSSIISLVMIIAAVARPHIAFLGRDPDSKKLSDLARHKDNESLPGVLIFRVESSLLYFNVDHIRQIVLDRIQKTTRLQLVICDLSNTPRVDVAGANMLLDLQKDLTGRDAQIWLANAHAQVRDLLQAAGLRQHVSSSGRELSVDQMITEFVEDAIQHHLASASDS